MKTIVNSDLNPLAQTPELLQAEKDIKYFKSKFDHMIYRDRVYGDKVKLIVWLLFQTGARISEVLQLKSSDITKEWFVKIRGLKGSDNRVVKVEKPPFPVFINHRIDYYLFPEFSRFFIYRVCKKYNLKLQVQGMKKESVTHAFRHYYATQALNLQDETNAAGKSLGHKSRKSILHYDKEKK